MKVRCTSCGKEYGLNEGESASDFTCECGGTLTERRSLSDVKKVNKPKTSTVKSQEKTCQSCGAVLPEGAKICPKCGFGDKEIKETKYCTNCAEEIDNKAEICPKCGVRQAGYTTQTNEKKSPVLSLILSFLIPGLGQFYNGHIEKGIILIVGYFLFIFLTVILTFILVGFFLAIIPFLIWVFGMYDAYVSADRINKGQPVKVKIQDYF